MSDGLPGYDAWKLRSPDWDDPPFQCSACDDMGCPECCEPVPITLDDLDELAEQITMNEPNYSGEPSYDLLDALSLPLLFHGGGDWDEAKRAEWLRITGTTEATTKVMCDHIRSALAIALDKTP